MEKDPKKLSYESDGKMGKKKKDVNQKSQRDENDLFFNTTQNSEWTNWADTNTFVSPSYFGLGY